MPGYKSRKKLKTGGRRRKHRKHTVKKVRRGRKVMKGGGPAAITLRRTLKEILDYLEHYDKQNHTKTREEFITFFKEYTPYNAFARFGENPRGPTQTYDEKTLEDNPTLKAAKLQIVAPDGSLQYDDNFYDAKHFGVKYTFGYGIYPKSIRDAMSQIPLTAEEICTIMSSGVWVYTWHGIKAFSYDSYYEILDRVMLKLNEQQGLFSNLRFRSMKQLINSFRETMSRTGTNVDTNIGIIDTFVKDLKKYLNDLTDLRAIFSDAIWDCRNYGKSFPKSNDVLKKMLS
jgi:hypothetical protein